MWILTLHGVKTAPIWYSQIPYLVHGCTKLKFGYAIAQIDRPKRDGDDDSCNGEIMIIIVDF